MTIEQITECTAEQLKAMTDEELLKHFQQYLIVTRPDQVQRVKQQPEKEMQKVYMSPAKKQALAELEASGIDISFMKRKFRK